MEEKIKAKLEEIRGMLQGQAGMARLDQLVSNALLLHELLKHPRPLGGFMLKNGDRFHTWKGCPCMPVVAMQGI